MSMPSPPTPLAPDGSPPGRQGDLSPLASVGVPSGASGGVPSAASGGVPAAASAGVPSVSSGVPSATSGGVPSAAPGGGQPFERGVGVVGVVLAAGGGSRMGRPKALLSVAGEPLVARAVRVLAGGGCDTVLVVLGACADEARALVPPGVSTVDNTAWADGMGSSLRAGLAALPPGAGAVVVGLVDQPRVTAVAVQRLVDAWRNGAVAAVATYDGRPRNPVLLSRAVLPGVAASAIGDRGARDWLRAHPALVTAVPCDGAGDPFDVDTPEDMSTLAAAGTKE